MVSSRTFENYIFMIIPCIYNIVHHLNHKFNNTTDYDKDKHHIVYVYTQFICANQWKCGNWTFMARRAYTQNAQVKLTRNNNNRKTSLNQKINRLAQYRIYETLVLFTLCRERNQRLRMYTYTYIYIHITYKARYFGKDHNLLFEYSFFDRIFLWMSIFFLSHVIWKIVIKK